MFNELGFGTSGHRRPELGRLAGHTALLRRMPQASLEAIIVVAGRKDRSACIVVCRCLLRMIGSDRGDSLGLGLDFLSIPIN